MTIPTATASHGLDDGFGGHESAVYIDGEEVWCFRSEGDADALAAAINAAIAKAVGR